jgi:4-hydroxyphenylpyruvate dioxygenase
VEDAQAAHDTAVENGAESVLPPTTQARDKGSIVMSEIHAYGDVVLRFISGNFQGPFLPSFTNVEPTGEVFGLRRLDHCVGNVPKLFDVTDYLMAITGVAEHPSGSWVQIAPPEQPASEIKWGCL